MTTWNVFMRGEDRTEFTISVDAASADEARREAEDRHEEATIIEVFDPRQRADEIYDRQQAMYDNDTWDLY